MISGGHHGAVLATVLFAKGVLLVLSLYAADLLLKIGHGSTWAWDIGSENECHSDFNEKKPEKPPKSIAFPEPISQRAELTGYRRDLLPRPLKRQDISTVAGQEVTSAIKVLQ